MNLPRVFVRRSAVLLAGAALLLGWMPAAQASGVFGVSADIQVSATSFYPVPDGIADQVSVVLTARNKDTLVSGHLTVTDAGGTVVRELDYDPTALGAGFAVVTWRGRYPSGRVVPAGDYTISVLATNKSKRTATYTATVRAYSGHVRHRTWRHTFRPAATVIARQKGPCSSLRRPARRGWVGSIGYRSCARRDSVAVTVHRVRVPDLPSSAQAYVPRYEWSRLLVDGRPASGSSGSRLVYAYVLKSGKFGKARIFRGAGRHAAPKVLGARGISAANGKHYVGWFLGVANGWSYDVRSVTVRVRYTWFR